MKQMIEQFAAFDLFGRENYEYYARVTGRVLRVQDEWICSFRFPNVGKSAQQHYACKCSWAVIVRVFVSDVFFFLYFQQ
jgi:Rho GTPase-activating protein 20